MGLRDLPSAALACITRFLDYEDAVNLMHIGGDMTLSAKLISHGGIEEVTASSLKSLHLLVQPFGFVPSSARWKSLYIPSSLSYKERHVPMLSPWLDRLPKTLTELRFDFPDAINYFVEAVDPSKHGHDVQLSSTTSCLSTEWTPVSLKVKLPLLRVLHFDCSELNLSNWWTDDMKRRFLETLPPTLTHLHLPPSWASGKQARIVPPPEIMRQLSYFSATSSELLRALMTPTEDEAYINMQGLGTLRLTEATDSYLHRISKLFANLTTLYLEFELDSHWEEVKGAVVLPSSLTDLTLARITLDAFHERIAALPAALSSLTLFFANLRGTLAHSLPQNLTQLTLGMAGGILPDSPMVMGFFGNAGPCEYALAPSFAPLPSSLTALTIDITVSSPEQLVIASLPHLRAVTLTKTSRAQFEHFLPANVFLTLLGTKGQLVWLTDADIQSLPPQLYRLQGNVEVTREWITPDMKQWNLSVAQNILRTRLQMRCPKLCSLDMAYLLTKDFFSCLSDPSCPITEIDGKEFDLPRQRRDKGFGRPLTLAFPPSASLSKLVNFPWIGCEVPLADLPQTLQVLDARQFELALSPDSPPTFPPHLDTLYLTLQPSIPMALSALPNGKRSTKPQQPPPPPPEDVFAHLKHSILRCLIVVPAVPPGSVNFDRFPPFQLPSTLTSFAINLSPFSYPKKDFTLQFAWPATLQHLLLPRCPLLLSTVTSILPQLRTLHVDLLGIDEASGALTEDNLAFFEEKLDRETTTRFARHILPSHIHLLPNMTAFIKWSQDSIKRLPKSLCTASFYSFDVSQFVDSELQFDFGACLPPSLLQLELSDSYRLCEQGAATLPRTLTYLSCAFSRLEDTSVLPPHLVRLNISQIESASSKFFNALPSTLETLTIQASKYERRALHSVPSTILRLSLLLPPIDLSEDQFFGLPKSLKRLYIGPSQHPDNVDKRDDDELPNYASRLQAYLPNTLISY